MGLMFERFFYDGLWYHCPEKWIVSNLHEHLHNLRLALPDKCYRYIKNNWQGWIALSHAPVGCLRGCDGGRRGRGGAKKGVKVGCKEGGRREDRNEWCFRGMGGDLGPYWAGDLGPYWAGDVAPIGLAMWPLLGWRCGPYWAGYFGPYWAGDLAPYWAGYVGCCGKPAYNFSQPLLGANVAVASSA
jgi:hypothetical protein